MWFESKAIFAGGGMKNLDEVLGATALCPDCHQFVIENYFNENSKCKKCGNEIIFYNDKRLQLNDSKSRRREVFF